MKTLETMTRGERSLLLFLETCAADDAGAVDARHMNGDDMETVKKWSEEGFVKFGRITFGSISGSYRNHWCELSDEAWSLAHQERRARFARMNEKRSWTRTEE